MEGTKAGIESQVIQQLDGCLESKRENGYRNVLVKAGKG